MLVTDRFVYIHMPKTGGTFVTAALARVHHPAPEGRVKAAARALVGRAPMLHGVGWRNVSRYGPLVDMEPKHGTCSDIPPEHAHKPVLSNIRNPYDWYVSQYEFAWWKRASEYHPERYPTPIGFALEAVLPAFERTHPRFPEISFEEFVELCDRAALVYNEGEAVSLGLFTHGFMRYFFRDVDAVVPEISLPFIASGRCRDEMFDVELLRTHDLNASLYAYLVEQGYAPEDVDFVRGLGRILPMGRGRAPHQRWAGYYTPELKRHVREREWVLFEMFPEFDD